MSIAWNYLDKRSAAMAALKDYRSRLPNGSKDPESPANPPQG